MSFFIENLNSFLNKIKKGLKFLNSNVMNEIKPAVESTTNITGERNSKNDVFVEAVAKQNVILAMQEIREKSEILREMEQKGEIMIVGGMYDLNSGKVEFYKN